MSRPDVRAIKESTAEGIRTYADTLIRMFPIVDPLVKIYAGKELNKLNRNLQPSAIIMSAVALKYGTRQTDDLSKWVWTYEDELSQGQRMTLTYKNYSNSADISDIQRNSLNKDPNTGDVLEIRVEPNEKIRGVKMRLKLNADLCLDEYTTDELKGGYKRLVKNGKFTEKGRVRFFEDFDTMRLQLQGVALSVLHFIDMQYKREQLGA